jgi:death-on-curing protein
VKKLFFEDIISLHSMLIDQIGGLGGLRDQNLLDSAIQSTYQTFNNTELYLTVSEKAAHFAYALINNHAFLDGNKRIGILSMLTLMEINGFFIECTNDELVSLGLGIAQGELTQKDIHFWLDSHLSDAQ